MKPITFCAERLPNGEAVRPILIDFDKFPHLICQGGTGTGKSVASLLTTAKISQLPGSQVFILDFKNDVDTFKFCHGSRDNYSVCLGMGNLTKGSASVLGFFRDEFLPITEIGGGHLIMGGRQYPVQIPYIGPRGMARMKEDILKALMRNDEN